MIIECINCNKKFEVDSKLIPSTGRTIQCGSCNHLWFFDNDHLNQERTTKSTTHEDIDFSLPKNEFEENSLTPANKNTKTLKKDKLLSAKNLDSKLINQISKSNFTFGKFLSYLIILIISFIGLVIILDTFKSFLYIYFPSIEFLLFSLFETLKDVQLFIKDLI